MKLLQVNQFKDSVVFLTVHFNTLQPSPIPHVVFLGVSPHVVYLGVSVQCARQSQPSPVRVHPPAPVSTVGAGAWGTTVRSGESERLLAIYTEGAFW